MKTIIVATDFSRPANNALEYGAAIARQAGARLVLVNTFHIPAPVRYTLYPSLKKALPDVQEMITEHKVRLDQMADLVKSSYGIEVETFTATSELPAALDDLVGNYQADMVVMGMRGQSVGRDIFGSNTLSVLREASFPLLIVPTEARYHGFERVLFACHWAGLPMLNRLPVLKNLAMLYKATVQVVHVSREELVKKTTPVRVSEKERIVHSVFEGVEHRYKEIKADDVIKGIEMGVNDLKADLLVMIPDRPNFWDIILRKSNTRHMALRTNIPLLVLPAHVV
jgi:nucleotide-binding universal stress UspA family protein